jgi:transposase
MRIDYRQAITESEVELAALEQHLRGRRTGVRVRLLRLLKGGQVSSLRAAAPLLGYRQRQLQTWWGLYKRGGLEALTHEKPRPGKSSRLTAAAYRGLEQQMAAGRVATLRNAQAYLLREWGIEYRSLNGVWGQLHKRRAKPKTGRRRHAKADLAAQEEYTSGVRHQAGAAGPGASVRL